MHFKAEEPENLENTNASLSDEKTKLAGANEDLLRKSKALARQKYVADLNLIPSLYRDGNIRQVVNLLLQHYPKPGEVDLRGFEWNYWMQAANLQKESFGPHFAPLGNQAISPNRKQVAVSLWWGSVFVFDVPGGLGNPASRKTLWYGVPDQGPRGLASVAFSNDGKTLIAAGPDDKVRRWNTDTWKRLPDIDGHATRHKSAAEFMILALAVSPTQPIMAFRGQKAGVFFYNVESGQEIGRLDSIDPLDVHALAFTPDGKTLLVGLKNSLLRTSVESAAQKSFVLETVAENIDRGTGTTTVHCLTCSPDGKQFVTGGDNMIRVWDAKTYAPIHVLPTAEPVSVMAYSADGSRLAASTRQNNTVLVWQIPTGRLFKTIRGHSRDVEGVCFVDNDTLWSCGSDGFLMSWDLSRCEPGQSAHHGTDGAVKLAYQAGGEKVLLFDSQGVRAASLENPVDASWLKRDDQLQNWSGNKQYMTAWSKDNQLHLWKADGTPLGQWQASANRMDMVAISCQDGKVGKVAWVEKEDPAAPTIVILDVATGQRTRLFNSAFAGDLSAMAISPGGDRLVAMHDPYRTGKACNPFWNIVGVPKVMDEFYATPAFDAAFSHDGKNVAAAYWSNQIRLYDTRTGALKSELAGHANSVRCLAYSDDDAVLVSGAEDGTVRVWDVLNGELRATLKGHVGTVLAVAIAPDKTSIASYAEDQQLRIWRASSPLHNPRSTHMIALELVQRQQWKEAVPYLRKGAEDDPDDTLRWLKIAPVLAFAGDRDLYKLHCLQMAANVRDDPNPISHERALKAALLLPDVPALIPQKSLKILRAALKKKPGEPGAVAQGIRPWLEGASALAYYRADQYPEALQALPTKPGQASLMALCGAIRALAMHKLGDRNALLELQKAGAAIDENLDFIRNNNLRTGQIRFNWHDWLYAEWIRREAQALMGGD